MARRSLFWHVPHWYSGAPGSGFGIGNNASGDIIAALIDEHDIVHIGQDNFTVVRIIGQYQITSQQAVAADRYIFHRVYVTTADSATIALRTLNTADDADSSFLWNNVEFYTSGQDSNNVGSWQSGTASTVNQPGMERNGTFDINVNRKVDEGTALVWHTQIFPGPPEDDFRLKLWVRLLVSEQ